jgi:hypothetical protein
LENTDTLLPAKLVPHRVTGDRAEGRERDRYSQVHLVSPRKRTHGKKQRRRRYRQARLFEKDPCEYKHVSVPDNELEQLGHFN